MSGSKSKLKNAAGDYIRERNITVPNHLILSGYRFADADKFLDVWYLVNPQFDGFPSYQRTSWTDSPWHPHSVATDPKKKAYIDRLKVWTEEWHQRVRAGFDEKLTGAAIQIPAKPTVSASPASESSSVADRLKQLDALFKKELISKEEYEQRRKQILDSL